MEFVTVYTDFTGKYLVLFNMGFKEDVLMS